MIPAELVDGRWCDSGAGLLVAEENQGTDAGAHKPEGTMIGRSTRAGDFKAALGYVLKKPGAEVLFDSNMCGIHDVTGATKLMLTEASASRTKQPVYHLSVSWDKNDGTTAAQMEMAAQHLALCPMR